MFCVTLYHIYLLRLFFLQDDEQLHGKNCPEFLFLSLISSIPENHGTYNVFCIEDDAVYLACISTP